MVRVFVDPAIIDVAYGDGVQVIPPESSLFLYDDKSGPAFRKTPPVWKGGVWNNIKEEV